MPAAQHLNGGVFNTCHCSSGGCTYSKAMAGILVLLEAQRIQNVPYLLNESLFSQCLMFTVYVGGNTAITNDINKPR